MINYTKRYINTISLIITIIIFSLSQILAYIVSRSNFNFDILNPFYKNSIQIKMRDFIDEEDKTKERIQNTYENTIQYKSENKETWKIKIPILSLEAQIEEGTTEEIMEDFVGHFSETNKMEGNIGLAAHNRGYKNNYFSDLKNLKKGDEIQYQYKDFKKTYIVEKHEIICDTDWTYLEKTEDNRLTLITCVENEPSYRRCIQAIEKKG